MSQRDKRAIRILCTANENFGPAIEKSMDFEKLLVATGNPFSFPLSSGGLVKLNNTQQKEKYDERRLCYPKLPVSCSESMPFEFFIFSKVLAFVAKSYSQPEK